jgi:RNA polymerase sigma-70 factor (ECF subfamily)
VDTASSKPDDLVLSVAAGDAPATAPILTSPVLAGQVFAELPAVLLEELWVQADAEPCALSRAEFGQVLASVGAKLNHNLPPGAQPDANQRADFYRSLHLPELALAHACALGREAAWERFLSLHRGPLTHAAISITGSATLGEELAGSLYAELYGLRERDGQRRSPLASYTGRGSLAGWLRTTLVQRFRDHHRRTHREAPLEGIDSPAPAAPVAAETTVLAEAVSRTLKDIDPEDRFLLVAYYLDRQTLLQIARTLSVHEATISRRLKRLVAGLRKQLLRNVCSTGLTRAAAEEALGADPRDIEINLRALLQTSQSSAFSTMRAASD